MTNVGSTPLAISKVQMVGAGFTENNNCGSALGPGANCVFKIRFAPTSATALTASPYFYGSLVVWDNDPASPQTVRVSSTASGILLKPNSLNFGSQAVGTSSPPLTVTLTNKSASTLTFGGSIVVSGDFSETDNCVGGVISSGNCTINVVFTPSITGTRKGTLVLNTNDISSPTTFNLTGTGN
jgi:hypothetical protein